ncbi:hypothetical protein [Cellulomonas sp.]|uniref:hypothetical protein n=1 Tax=Cellulomonas sp. TaxID=40001 RepID=UPI0025840EDA|nr:hypothetical protein [Cellulomonas sp.]MCR6689060.1 hypothetical protein [Cellulomonas sp.]
MTDPDAVEIPMKVCPHCAVQATTAGAFCPHCGKPYAKRGPSRKAVVIAASIGAGLVLVGGGVAFAMTAADARADERASAAASASVAAAEQAAAERAAAEQAAAEEAAAEQAAADEAARAARAATVKEIEKSIKTDARGSLRTS